MSNATNDDDALWNEVHRLRRALALIGIEAACPAAEYVPALIEIVHAVEDALLGLPVQICLSSESLKKGYRNPIECFALEVIGPGDRRNAILGQQASSPAAQTETFKPGMNQ